jgi:uncharacterized protein YukE
MAVEQGMNRPVVIEVAGQLTQDHGTLTDIQHNADQSVRTLGENWFGADAQQYASDWQQHSRTLTDAATMIQQMSKLANDQAQQQESTSQR